MRPDPFKRVGAYCFCRCVLFRRWAIFSAVDIMFPAGRIFSAVMSLLSAVRVFYLTYRIVPADRRIISRVCFSDGICVAEILFRSGRHCFGRAQRRLQEMAGGIHPEYKERKKGRLCRLALYYLEYCYIACECLLCLGACGAILGRAVARAVDIVVLEVVDAHGYALHGGLAHAGVVLLDDKPLAA